MLLSEIEPGDLIFAATTITNDGSLPGVEDSAVVAEKGQRGIILNTGHLEENPNKVLILVRFEQGNVSGTFGPAVACWPEELCLPEVDEEGSASVVN